MAKLPRVTHIPFGGSAIAGVNGIAQFGSKQAGSPVYTTNIATMQSLGAWLAGLAGMVTAGKLPPLEELNAAFVEPSYQIGYLLQQGIPEYDSGTTYYTYSIVQYNGVLYQSTADSNTGNTPGSSSQWKYFNPGATKGENLFRNAGLAVQQRGNGGVVFAGTPAYGPDGWILSPTGANVAWNIYDGAVLAYTNAPNSLIIGAAPGMTDFNIKQRIESTVMSTVPGNTFVTFQATIHNGLAFNITPTLTINVPTLQDNYASVVTLVNGVNLQTVNTGSTTVVSYTFQLTNQDYLLGMEVILDFGIALNTSGGSIMINSFDVSPTPFFTNAGLQSAPPLAQIRPIGIELPFNLRYFRQLASGHASVFYCQGWASSSTAATFLLPSTPMRVAPTLSYSSLSDFAIGTGAASYTHPLTALNIVSNTLTDVIALAATVGSGLTTGACILDNYTGSAVLSFSAEL